MWRAIWFISAFYSQFDLLSTHGAGTWDKLFSGSQGQERERKKNWRPKDQIPAFSMISRTRLFCSCLAPSQRLSSSSCTGSSKDFPSIWAVMPQFRKVPFPVFNISENFPVGCARGDGENGGLSNWYSGLDGLVFYKGIWVIHILGHWYLASPAPVTE